MRWSARLAVCGLGLVPLALVTTVLADTGPNPKLSVSQGTYYITQIFSGAIAKVTVASDGSVKVTEDWISGLPSGGPDSAVFASDGTMIASNFNSGTISRVDVNSRKVLQKQVNKVPYDGAVADLATDPKSNAVYYIFRGGSDIHAVGRLDLGSGVSKDLNPDLVEDVGGIAVSDDGSRLFVSSGAGYIAELNTGSGHLLRKEKVRGAPDGMSWDPSNGYLYASGCGGICQLSTGGDGGSSLHLVKTLDGADGDGIAADGQGHVYVAEASCGSLCRLDVSTNKAFPVALSISGADDVTPLAGAGSSAGACLAVVSCLGGAGGAGLAAAGIGLIAFMGAAGFTAMRPAAVHVAGGPAHAGAAHAPAAVAAHGAEAGAPAHAAGAGPPGGHEAVAGGAEAGHLQEEAGDKLLEIGGAGLEVGAGAAPSPPPVPEPPPTAPPSPPEPGPPGATRQARDDREEQGGGPAGQPAPPAV